MERREQEEVWVLETPSEGTACERPLQWHFPRVVTGHKAAVWEERGRFAKSGHGDGQGPGQARR